tara:strand:- start:1668 stop:1868 length:201 start_codon:yes stop_codon:yes gene_type:complete
MAAGLDSVSALRAFTTAAAKSVEAVEKNQKSALGFDKTQKTGQLKCGIPRFKHYKYDQGAMVVIDY